MSQYAIIPTISLLILGCCPAAVFGSVIFVVIDTIKPEATRRPSTNIINEVVEAFFPSATHFDATTAVVTVIFVVLVVTSTLYGIVGIIFSFVSPSLCSFCLAGYFAFVAATASGLARDQAVLDNDNYAATFALAYPFCSVSFGDMGESENFQSVESSARYIFEVVRVFHMSYFR